MPEEKPLRSMDLGELVSELISLEVNFTTRNLGITTDNYTEIDMEEFNQKYGQRKENLISEIGRRENHSLPRRAI